MAQSPLKRLEKASDSLISKYRLEPSKGTGAFGTGTSSLHRVEYLMHEIAHALTLGLDPIPEDRPLHQAISDQLDKISVSSRDSLEIDTSYVVWGAGKQLGLWGSDLNSSEALQIASSCAGNLDADVRISSWEVLAEFSKRVGDSALSDAIQNLVTTLLGVASKNAASHR